MTPEQRTRRIPQEPVTPGPDNKPLIGHYEDLLAWQGRVIDRQNRVIEDLSGIIRRISYDAGAINTEAY